MQHKQVLVVGLGKMGSGIALQLKDKGYDVFGYNRNQDVTRELESKGIVGIYDFSEIKMKLSFPRVVWVMVPAGDATDEVILGQGGLTKFLEKGDYIVDAGNSNFKHTKAVYKQVESLAINYMDVGVSGGPSGARNGACMMIGGSKVNFEYLEPIFRVLCVDEGYEFFEGNGAGHFVKMIHNGVEYGMMQAIAEGFGIMKNSDYNLDLTRIANVYNHGSVIESRLVGWLKDGFEKYSENLTEISGSIAHSGEGLWSVETAREMGVEIPVIQNALDYRIKSTSNPSYIGKIVSVLRNMFGGHDVSK